MADAKVVVQYDIDLGEFDAKVEQATAGYAELDKAAKEATKGTTALSGATGSLTDKVEALVEEEKRAAVASKELATTAEKNVSIFRRVGEGIKQFGLGARDGFRTAIKEVGGFRGIVTQVGANIKGFGASASGAFKALGSQITNVAGQVPLIGGLATALGPVGIAAAAAAGGLLSIVKNTDAGATALDGLGKTGGLVFDRITGLAVSFFDTFTSSDTVIGRVAGALGDVLGVLLDIVTGPLQLLGEFTGITDALKEDFAAGQLIANQLDELADKQLAVNEAVAKNEIGIRKNLSALRDTTKPVEERLRIADEITRVEEQNLALRKSTLQTELNILKTQAQQQLARKGEVDDALKKQISDLNVAIANAEAESVSLTERIASRRAGIVEQEEQKKAAIRAKAIAAREKAEQEAAKKAEQRAAAEAKLNEVVADLARESFERGLTDAEREVEAVKKKYADLEAATLEGAQKLREASPASAQSEITAKEAKAIIAIDKAKNEELAALEKKRAEDAAKTREEEVERIRKSLLSETELQREEVNNKYDELLAAAEKNIKDEDELERVRLGLAKKREEALTGIVTNEERKRTEAAQAEQQRREQLQQQNAQLITDFAVQTSNIVAAAAANAEDIGEQASKAIVGLLLDTLEKIILANAFQVQAISAGAPDPANVASGGIFGIARGIVLAGIVKALFGAAKAAITANYEGDPYVGGDGSKPMWSGRDGFLRRLDRGERVVRTKTNEAHYDALEAMEAGKFDDWVLANYMPAFDAIIDDDRMVRYANSDTGQRMAASITLPRMFDKGMVTASGAIRKEQQRTNELLAQMVKNAGRGTSKRYY